MLAVFGLSKSRADAEHGVALGALGIPNKHINVVTPEASETELASVPASQGEQPGMVKT